MLNLPHYRGRLSKSDLSYLRAILRKTLSIIEIPSGDVFSQINFLSIQIIIIFVWQTVKKLQADNSKLAQLAPPYPTPDGKLMDFD